MRAINVSEDTAVTAIFTHASLVANSNGNRIAEFGHRVARGLDKLQTIPESPTPIWKIVQGYMSGQLYASMYGAYFAGGWNGLTEGITAGMMVEHFDELVSGYACG